MKTIAIAILISLFSANTILAQKVKARRDNTKVEGVIEKESKMRNPGDNFYVVIAPHSKEQCLKILNNMSDEGLLSEFKYGCKSGDHTVYAILNGSDENSVREMLPKENRAAAEIRKVDIFTKEQLKELHK